MAGKGEYIQLYYEIAMAIGNSLDLEEMVREALFAYTRKLNCCSGIIVRVRENEYDTEKKVLNVYSVPKRESQLDIIDHVLDGARSILEKNEIGSLPVVKKCVAPLFCHCMTLPGFGLLFLLKKEEPLLPHILHSLSPLNKKLSRYCLACENKRSLEESEAKYRRIFEAVRDVYVEVEIDPLRILEISPSVKGMLGYTREELLGRNIEHLFVEDPKKYYIRNRLIEERRVVDMETRLRSKNGDLKVISISASIHTENAERRPRIAAILRDIGRRKQAEDALLESRNRLEDQVLSRTRKLREANASLEAEVNERIEVERNLRNAQAKLIQSEKMAGVGQLASGIAHEINNPIQYIGSNLLFLEEGCDSLLRFIEHLKATSDDSLLKKELQTLDFDYLQSKIPESLEHSIEGVEQITSIVNGMNIFAHSGDQDKTLNSINEIIRNTLKISKSEWKKTVRVEKHLDDQIPDILCVRHSIGQVVLNVLINAVHAIEDRRKIQPDLNGVIAFRSSEEADSVLITIQDNGVGIEPESLNRVFEPFYTTKDPGRGTGQGLSIVYSIVTQEHGGTVEIKSDLENGTIVSIRLPISL